MQGLTTIYFRQVNAMPVNRAADSDLIERELRGGVCRLTLNRADKFNALSEEMLTLFQQYVDVIKSDDSIRCVVIAAKGKAFCAGHDLKQMRKNPGKPYYQKLFTQCSTLMQSLVALPVPVIAQVQGIATAAGCQLVASCDIAVASHQARFAVSGINAGLFCSTPAVALSRNMNTKDAFKMLVTGEFIDAGTAMQKGLINEVVDEDQLAEKVNQITDIICAKSPVAIRTGKSMFYKQKELNLADAYKFAGEIMACNMMEADACEGIDAFIEKRQPKWK